MEHGDDADGEVAGDAAADLEEADGRPVAGGGIPAGEGDHVFDAGADGVDIFHIPFDAMAGIHVAEGGVFPAGDEHGEVFLLGGDHPAVFGIDLETFLEFGRVEDAPEEFVGEEAFALRVGIHPLFEDDIFDAAHGFHFGDAGVGDAVHVALEEGLLVGGGEVAVVGDAFVEIVGDEVEDVFLEVGAGADDAVDFSLADHFGEGDAEFGGAHGAGEGHEHDAAGVEVAGVGFGGVLEGGGVEVAVVEVDELGDGTGFHGWRRVFDLASDFLRRAERRKRAMAAAGMRSAARYWRPRRMWAGKSGRPVSWWWPGWAWDVAARSRRASAVVAVFFMGGGLCSQCVLRK